MKKIKFFREGSYESLEKKIEKWIEEEVPTIVQINPVVITGMGSYTMQILYEAHLLDLGGE